MALKRANPPARWYPKRGEICLFALDKERPALVISSDAINVHSLDVRVVPISTAERKPFHLEAEAEGRRGWALSGLVG